MKKQTSKQKQATEPQEHTLPQPLTGHSDTVEQIEISIIAVSPNNPRRSHTEADIRELADSITMHGVIQPITLRSSESGYMIVCGERRYRAAMMAGLTLIPAIVRPYTQEQAMEVTIIENLQRKDISPVEESDSFVLLMKQHGYTVEELTKRFGKSEKYIRSRLQLANLIDSVAELLNRESISLTVAMIISEFSTDIQQDIYEKHLAIDEPSSWINLTANAFRAMTAKAYTTDLNRFEFDKTECLSCTSNTANQTLFADSNCGGCTNRDCLIAKQRQHTVDICKKMIEENPSVAFAVPPQASIDGNLIQEIGEAGAEIFEVYANPLPEKPQEPKPTNYQSDAEYTEAVEEFEIDSEMYKGEMEIIEEKFSSGEYQKMIDLSTGTPQIGYRVLVEEKQPNPSAAASSSASASAPVSKAAATPAKVENPVEKLREQDKRNKAISIEKTVEDVKKMLQKEEITPIEFTEQEDNMLYFIMLSRLRSQHNEQLGLGDKYSISDENKVAVITSLTAEQKALIKRDFITSHLTEAIGANTKSELMLPFARLHFNDEVDKLAKPYNDVYEKRRTSIIQRLRALGAKLEPSKAKTKKSDKTEAHESSQKQSPEIAA